MNEYPRAGARPRRLASREELGIWLFPNLRLRNATDGLHRAQAGLPVRVPRLGDRLQGARRTTTGAPTRRRTSTTARSPTACGCARASCGASTSAGSARRSRVAPRQLERVVARAHLAGEGRLVDRRRAARPTSGPGSSPSSAIRSSPRTGARGRSPARHASASRGQLARQREVALDRLGRACARRGSRAGRRPTAPSPRARPARTRACSGTRAGATAGARARGSRGAGGAAPAPRRSPPSAVLACSAGRTSRAMSAPTPS